MRKPETSAGKHTPGPWAAGNERVLGPGGKKLFECYSKLRTMQECQANAHLIAAAPDMLAALRLVERSHPTSKHIGVIRAAIAKATGGAP